MYCQRALAVAEVANAAGLGKSTNLVCVGEAAVIASLACGGLCGTNHGQGLVGQVISGIGDANLRSDLGCDSLESCGICHRDRVQLACKTTHMQPIYVFIYAWPSSQMRLCVHQGSQLDRRAWGLHMLELGRPARASMVYRWRITGLAKDAAPSDEFQALASSGFAWNISQR